MNRFVNRLSIAQIQDTPGQEIKLTNVQTTANSVTFTVTDRSMNCIKICRYDEKICSDYFIENSEIFINKLSPNTDYKFLFWSCGNHNNLLNEFSIRTPLARKCFSFILYSKQKM